MGDNDRSCHAGVARLACLYMLSHPAGWVGKERLKDRREGIVRSTI